MARQGTVQDAADILGVTEGTVRRYLKEGTLRGQKRGVQWFVCLDDADELADSMEADSAEDEDDDDDVDDDKRSDADEDDEDLDADEDDEDLDADEDDD